ncbi:DUF4349 domain-containing protein [Saccharothrix syringae]|uniref:DUF4349 domain-containing protein n=2 Tax=Saccharothrix syringae TaxID=103733 RepID=A0A5Q0HFI2_SACSY|nr:DUF4349 domain-containing protein [Saccharothrix syringae]
MGAALAACAVLALAGCSAGSSDSSAGMAADQAAPAQAPLEQPGVAKEGQPGGQQQAGGTSARQERQLVRTAAVELRAVDVTGTLTRVRDLVTGQGGYSEREDATPERASVTLRVPGERLDGVLASLQELDDAEVVRREVRTEDVTEQVVDVEARLANQRASVARVRGLLDRAGTTSEITGIEAELTKRLSELESLERRYEALKGQVSLSTLTVTVGSRPAPPAAAEEDGDQGFLGALAGGWRALTTTVGWVLVVVGAVLPFAVVLGVPAAAYLWWSRRRRGEAVEAVEAVAPSPSAGA